MPRCRSRPLLQHPGLRPCSFQGLDLHLPGSLLGSATKQDRELNHKPGPEWGCGTVFSPPIAFPFRVGVGETEHYPLPQLILRLVL